MNNFPPVGDAIHYLYCINLLTNSFVSDIIEDN
jgi:hypothetical protein